MMDATRIMTAGAVDLGEKPAVLSAIAKYHMTERARACVNDAMDIHGGKGICLGPNNWIGRGYQVMPIAITVEGANILTRTLIIFGQGAIRCHPYVLREMRAAKEMQGAEASREFDDALTSHIGHTLSNGVRAFVLRPDAAPASLLCRAALRQRRDTTTGTSRACRRPSPSSPTCRCSRWAARSSARRRSPGASATCCR